jgi:hypothetical protein
MSSLRASLLLFGVLLSGAPSWGQTDYVLDFAVGDKVSTTSSFSALDSLSQLTFEVEVLPHSVPDWTHLLSRVVNATDRVSLQAHQGRVYCIVSNGANSYASTPSAVLSPGVRHHLAMVFDGSLAMKVQLYVDGVAQQLVTGGAALPSTTPNNSAAFEVGGGVLFDGQLDEVRVWDTALSAVRLAAWKDRPLDATHPELASLRLYWPCDDASTPLKAQASLGAGPDGDILGAVYLPEAPARGATGPGAPRPDVVVGGYLPYYELGVLTERVFEHLTHAYYFSLAPSPIGALGRVDSAGAFTPLSMLPSVAMDIDTLRAWRGSRPTKILVVLGGWIQSDYFDEAVANPVTRANLVANTLQFCRTYGVDGVDLDWESYHGAINDVHYGLLVHELREAFRGTDLQLVATIGPSHTSLAGEFAETDFVQLMTYGNTLGGGTQVSLATLGGWVDSWLAAGLPESQVVIGLPDFGRTSANSSSIKYRDAIQLYAPPASQDWVVHNGATYYFNGVDTIRSKALYARSHRLRGVMFWELGQDLPVGHPRNLLRTVGEVLPVQRH